MKDFKNKVVVITGGATGIGKAMADRFGAEGAKVIISARRENRLQEAVKDLTDKGVDARYKVCDVSKLEDVKALADYAWDEFGHVDVLVNNAGITRDGLLVRMKTADWDAVLDTNLKGAFLCTRAVAKIMMKQRYGRIINIASVVGVTGNAGQANYSASKAGIIGFTKTTARELASRGVTVNAVAPGFIETDMTASLPEKAKTAMMAQIPMGRIGKPEDVAAAIGFLASDSAMYITGQVIHVNGGMF